METTAWNNLGPALAETGELIRAQRCFERTLATEPSDLAALSGLASIHRTRGRNGDAGQRAQAVIRYRESNPYYLLSVAREEFSNGNLVAARHHLKRAISIKLDEPELLKLMAEVARGLGLEAEAKRWTLRSLREES